jgi:hypothetical protein
MLNDVMTCPIRASLVRFVVIPHFGECLMCFFFLCNGFFHFGQFLKIKIDNCFGNKNFMQPMRSLGKVLMFFFWVFGGGWKGVFLFFCVPIKFLRCSHQVFKMFPKFPMCLFFKTFSITPHFLSHIVWPWFNFHIYV